jgi:hypothetical protein
MFIDPLKYTKKWVLKQIYDLNGYFIIEINNIGTYGIGKVLLSILLHYYIRILRRAFKIQKQTVHILTLIDIITSNI